MTNKEAVKYLIRPIATSTKPSAEYLKQKEAYDLAIKALKEVKRLEEENHSNFVKSQHIISILVEEIKELRGEEYKGNDTVKVEVTEVHTFAKPDDVSDLDFPGVSSEDK